MEKIVITGASGFVGSALTKQLNLLGYSTEAISTKDYEDEECIFNKLKNSYAVINLAGAPIIKRWSDEYKKILYSSRVDTTKKIVDAIEKLENKPKFLFSTSAVGYYKSNEEFNENGQKGNDFLADLCDEWEHAALMANKSGVRVCIGRFGIVFGKNGGALMQMLPIFRLGLGGIIASGKQPMSYIQITDLVNAIIFLMQNGTQYGIYNFTTPNPTTNYELTKTLGAILHRPTIFPVPEFALKLLYSEGAKVLTDGQIAIPKKLLDAGFIFKYPTLIEALKASID